MTEPTRIPIAADSIEEINDFIATTDRHRSLKRGDVLVVPGVMWARASGDTRIIFQDLCAVYGLRHRDATAAATEPFIERGAD